MLYVVWALGEKPEVFKDKWCAEVAVKHRHMQHRQNHVVDDDNPLPMYSVHMFECAGQEQVDFILDGRA